MFLKRTISFFKKGKTIYPYLPLFWNKVNKFWKVIFCLLYLFKSNFFKLSTSIPLVGILKVQNHPSKHILIFPPDFQFSYFRIGGSKNNNILGGVLTKRFLQEMLPHKMFPTGNVSSQNASYKKCFLTKCFLTKCFLQEMFPQKMFPHIMFPTRDVSSQNVSYKTCFLT